MASRAWRGPDDRSMDPSIQLHYELQPPAPEGSGRARHLFYLADGSISQLSEWRENIVIYVQVACLLTPSLYIVWTTGHLILRGRGGTHISHMMIGGRCHFFFWSDCGGWWSKIREPWHWHVRRCGFVPSWIIALANSFISAFLNSESINN